MRQIVTLILKYKYYESILWLYFTESYTNVKIELKTSWMWNSGLCIMTLKHKVDIFRIYDCLHGCVKSTVLERR